MGRVTSVKVALTACVMLFSASFAQGASAQLEAVSDPDGPGGKDLIDLSIFAERGFDLDAVDKFVREELGYVGGVRKTASGKRFALYDTTNGLKFVVEPDFCADDVCLGLIFRSFFAAADFNVDLSDINAFNAKRPHGNAALSEKGKDYVVQRISWNISGVTTGEIAAMFDVYQAYADVFARYLTKRSRENTLAARRERARRRGELEDDAPSSAPSTFRRDMPASDDDAVLDYLERTAPASDYRNRRP